MLFPFFAQADRLLIMVITVNRSIFALIVVANDLPFDFRKNGLAEFLNVLAYTIGACCCLN